MKFIELLKIQWNYILSLRYKLNSCSVCASVFSAELLVELCSLRECHSWQTLPLFLVTKISYTGDQKHPAPPLTDTCYKSLSFELRRQTFSNAPSRRVSIATTSKVPECPPPTSDLLPPCVPFRWQQAAGTSLRSPYQMFHSWQEQVHL